MSGCIPDEIMITSPKPGAEVKGTVKITGTANAKNLAFYKYEIAPVGTQNWATVAADRDPVKDGDLGELNTIALTNGDYFLRLVVVDNVGNSLEPCVIALRVANQ